MQLPRPDHSPVEIQLYDTPFWLVTCLSDFREAIQQHQRAVYRFRTKDWADCNRDLLLMLEDEFGEKSRQTRLIFSSLVICGGCLWEYPGSYKLAIQTPELMQGQLIGAMPGHEEFGQSGECTLCGVNQSLLIFDDIDPETISAQEVQAIKQYWARRAAAFWENGRGQTPECRICDDPITPADGYLTENRWLCRDCLECSMMDAVQQLRDKPDYYGIGLLTKVRSCQ